MPKKRLEEFDLLKGIGILLMVLGHSNINDTIHDMIYSFHMPLFMVSGYFFNVQPVQTYLKKMFFRLIIPWSFFVTVNLLLSFSLDLYSTHNVAEATKSIVSSFSPIDENCHLLYRSIWFLIALFITGNLYNLLNNFLGRRAMNLVVLIFYFTGFALQLIVNVPFFIDTSISVLLFYHFGVLARTYIDKTDKFGIFKRDDILVFMTMLLIFIGLMCLTALYRPEIDFKANLFPVWVPLLSAPIIIALYYLLKVFTKQVGNNPMKSFLIKCGLYSICILGLHRPFQEAFHIIFSKLPIPNPSIQTAIYIIISVPVILFIARVLEKYAPVLIGFKRK